MCRGRGSPWCPLCEPNGGESSYVSLLWIVLVCVRRSRNNSHNADGKCQALPSMVFLVRVDGWSGVICVKLSGNPIKNQAFSL